MASFLLPRFVSIKANYSELYAYYMTEPEEEVGGIRCGEQKVFSPLAKIQIERAKVNSKFVHLRFCHSNKYWVRGENDKWIVATSDKPQEDTSKWSCTLFEPTISKDDGFLYFTHVQSGRRVRMKGLSETVDPHYLHIYVEDSNEPDPWNACAFTFFDWAKLVIMPKLVAFKGYNGRYLKASMIEGHEYLEFSSDDSNEEAACFEVIMHPDGHLRIKSKYFGKFWRRSPDWIWADSTNTYEISNDTLFWPVLFVDNDPKDEDKKKLQNVVVLRNAGNDRICTSLSTEGKKDCLNAAATTAIKETKLTIEELVSQRDIFNVNYHLKDARIYDEQATIVGAGSADNDTDKETTLTLKVGYETSTSKSFTYNLSIMAGVCTAFTAGIPCIAEGKIEVSVEVTNSFEWNTTDTKTKKAEAEYGVTVPPRSKVLVNYVATEGKCDVPFSYTQRDKLSTDGSFITAEHVDGIYTGSNYYNFHFEQHQPRRL